MNNIAPRNLCQCCRKLLRYQQQQQPPQQQKRKFDDRQIRRINKILEDQQQFEDARTTKRTRNILPLPSTSIKKQRRLPPGRKILTSKKERDLGSVFIIRKMDFGLATIRIKFILIMSRK